MTSATGRLLSGNYRISMLRKFTFPRRAEISGPARRGSFGRVAFVSQAAPKELSGPVMLSFDLCDPASRRCELRRHLRERPLRVDDRVVVDQFLWRVVADVESVAAYVNILKQFGNVSSGSATLFPTRTRAQSACIGSRMTLPHEKAVN